MIIIIFHFYKCSSFFVLNVRNCTMFAFCFAARISLYIVGLIAVLIAYTFLLIIS